MKIIHFSDIHICCAPNSIDTFFDKRIFGTLNFFLRRRFTYDISIVKTAVDFIIKTRPDIVICTGDLTSTGSPKEFDKISEILEPIIKSKIPFLYVPGNHDNYVKNENCQKALKKTFSELNTFFNISLTDLPVLVEFGNLLFCLINETKPTEIFSSCGFISPKDMEFIRRNASSSKKPVILVGHFPLHQAPIIFNLRRRLWGGNKILNMLVSGDITLSLCGHTHKTYINLNKEGKGEITAGSLTMEKKLNIITFDPKNNTFTCATQCLL